MIIGIGHRKGMGKDTFAQMLQEELNGNLGDDTFYYIESFADRVKDHAYYMFSDYGLRWGGYYEAHRDEKEEMSPTLLKSPREIYLMMGQFGRSVREDYWIEQVIRNDSQNLIIPDLRYPNEHKRIMALGGMTIRVHNQRVEVTHDEADDALEGCFFNYHIFNDGSLDDMKLKAKKMAVIIKLGVW